MSGQVKTTWDPGQYDRFAAEREQPFWDLAALLEPVEAPAVVDLGCGDGRLAAELHARLGARRTVGIDSSPAMLEAASAHAHPGVTVAAGDLATWQGEGVDIVFSNAALHWVPDHAAVLARWTAALAPGGQLAVQMPTNADHASHRVSRALAEEWLGADAPADPVAANVLAPEAYAVILDDLGFARQQVRLQVYGHHLDRTADVVEWVKGSSLTRFAAILGQDDYDRFVAEYRARLLRELGDRSPFFYTFKRIVMWARRP
jgi:trans-aconitate 2-methyltransferase